MTDQDDERTPAYDDPAYDELRGLLAGARATSAVPDDVAARLDATLADLVADRGPQEPETTVTPLRRRSRLAPRLLVAAAAVVFVGAGGVGLSQVLSGSSTDSASDTGGVATSADGARDDAAGSESAPEDAPSAPQPLGGDDVDSGGLAYDEDGLPKLTTTEFTAGTTQLSALRLQAADAGTGDVAGRTPGSTTPADGLASPGDVEEQLKLDRLTQAAKACPGPIFPGARIVQVLLDDEPAVVVFHPMRAGLELVEARTCDGTEVLAATTLVR